MKKQYQSPKTAAQPIILRTNIAELSEGEETEGRVHDPDDEVDAEEALINYRNAWEDENGLW